MSLFGILLGCLLPDLSRDLFGNLLEITPKRNKMKTIDEIVKRSVMDSVFDSFQWPARMSFINSVEDSVWVSLWNSVYNSIGRSVGGSVWRFVGESVWTFTEEKMK